MGLRAWLVHGARRLTLTPTPTPTPTPTLNLTLTLTLTLTPTLARTASLRAGEG